MPTVLSVRLTDNEASALDELYKSYGINGESQSVKFRKLLLALLSKSDNEPIDLETEVVEEPSNPIFEFPNIKCEFASPFFDHGQPFIWCDDPKLRLTRKTNKIPVLACVRCDLRKSVCQTSSRTLGNSPPLAPKALTAPSPALQAELELRRAAFNRELMQKELERIDLLIQAHRPDLLKKPERDFWDEHKGSYRRRTFIVIEESNTTEPADTISRETGHVKQE